MVADANVVANCIIRFRSLSNMHRMADIIICYWTQHLLCSECSSSLYIDNFVCITPTTKSFFTLPESQTSFSGIVQPL